jgi:hypothetical protein
MGQYYTAVNLDKKQILRPHACNDGAKLLEFGLSSMGMMSCLAILLADGNGRGGGDLFGNQCRKCKGQGSFGSFKESTYEVCPVCRGARREPASEIVGSWAGDRIVITGDYADVGKFVSDTGDKETNLYHNVYAEDSEYVDISLEAMRALAHDSYVRQSLQETANENKYYAEMLKPILAP